MYVNKLQNYVFVKFDQSTMISSKNNIRLILVLIAPLFVYYLLLFIFQYTSLFFPPLFFLQVGFQLMFSILNISQIKISFHKRLAFTLLIVVFYLCIMLNGFFNSFKNKVGLAFTRNNPHEYSSQHWYFLNRVSYIYPFDPTGLAYISKKDGLILPDGYRTTKPILDDGWYSIITNRFYIWAIIQGILGWLFCITFAAKKLNTEKVISVD